MSDQISITLGTDPETIKRVAVGLQAMAEAMDGGAPKVAAAPATEGNDAAPTATGPAGGEAQSGTDSAPAGGAASDPNRVDHHGVAFNADYCGEATDPFYGSGKRSGQWKKKRGVSEEVYDAWYAEQRAALEPEQQQQQQQQQQPQTEPPANTAGAFSQQAPAEQPQTMGHPFGDAGQFMGWVSEKQAAGLLSQDQIQTSYARAGVQVSDLFPPTAPEAVSANIGKVYDQLLPIAGA